MLEIVSVAPELFVSVTVCGALVVPTACAAKVRLAGARVTGTTAFPFRLRICGLPGPDVATTAPPLMVPGNEGVNVTVRVHLAPAARGPPQGVVPLPATAKLPLALSELMVTALALLLVTVTGLLVLVAPTPVALKLTLVGLNFSGAVGPPVPVPESATICAPRPELSEMVSPPATAPAEVGWKVTATVHFAPPASVAPQVPPVTVKLPPVAKLRFNDVVSLLVRVTDLAAWLPTATVPRLRAAGLNVSGATPLPARVTNCGLLPALSLMVSAPVMAPSAPGANFTPMVQLDPAFNEPGQLLFATKLPLAVIAPMVSGLDPVLVRVTVWLALVEPAA